VLAVAGVLVATVPSSRAATFSGDGQAISVSFRCKVPVFDVLGVGDEGGGWIAFAPNTSKAFTSGRISCRPEAYWRSATGAALVAAAVLVLITTRRRRRAPTGYAVT
jgi:MYXO-CTERM domain-containing protein